MESEDVAVADAAAFVVGAGVAGLVVEPDTVVVALVLVATVPVVSLVLSLLPLFRFMSLSLLLGLTVSGCLPFAM